jgi:hypothetical protein
VHARVYLLYGKASQVYPNEFDFEDTRKLWEKIAELNSNSINHFKLQIAGNREEKAVYDGILINILEFILHSL